MKWFKTKQAITSFSILALAGGITFLNKPGITGNITKENNLTINVLPIIGLILIFCSLVLGAYAFKSEK